MAYTSSAIVSSESDTSIYQALHVTYTALPNGRSCSSERKTGTDASTSGLAFFLRSFLNVFDCTPTFPHIGPRSRLHHAAPHPPLRPPRSRSSTGLRCSPPERSVPQLLRGKYRVHNTIMLRTPFLRRLHKRYFPISHTAQDQRPELTRSGTVPSNLTAQTFGEYCEEQGRGPFCCTTRFPVCISSNPACRGINALSCADCRVFVARLLLA